MIKTTYVCDKCGEEIQSVAYTLICTAKAVGEDILSNPGDMAKILDQNLKDRRERHLCEACKDKITDGLFIV